MKKWPLLKFSVIGVSNTAVDLIIFNLLIFISGITSGVFFVVWRTIAGITASLNSFFWNKRWTFQKQKTSPYKEIQHFYAVVVLGGIINVSVASLIVHYLPQPSIISNQLWANVGALGGSLSAFIWNFLGCKYFVFKTPSETE